MAKIRINRDGIEYKETQTFGRKAAAVVWLEKREEELRKPGELSRASRPQPTFADAIDKYIASSIKAIGRTKAQVLRAVRAFPIAGMECRAIKSTHVVEFAEALLKSGRKPQTVGNYLSHLQSVFVVARPAWAYDLDEQAAKDAVRVLKYLGVVASSQKRDVRPTMDQIDAIMALYHQRMQQRIDMAPMTHIVAFAIFSTRRQEEITRIRWSDFDEANGRVLVRDMKNPGEKKGNNIWCDLPAPAVDIIKAMPRVAAEIFPFNGEAISASFTRICKALRIEDLHFHDLRHDGVSRLFEMDYSIPKVAAVSGHRSWASLNRYTHLRQTGDKYAGWCWIEEVVKPARSASRPPSRRSMAARGLHLS